MVSTGRAGLQVFFVILCTLNGLNSVPRNYPPLGILNEVLGQDSKSPLIVVVDSNNRAKTLNDDEPKQQQRGQSQGRSKSSPLRGEHDHNPLHNHGENHVHHHSIQFTNEDYELALNELLRTSDIILDIQRSRKKNKNSNNFNNKVKKCNSCSNENENCNSCSNENKTCNSCSNEKEELLAEQCSNSGHSSCETC